MWRSLQCKLFSLLTNAVCFSPTIIVRPYPTLALINRALFDMTFFSSSTPKASCAPLGTVVKLEFAELYLEAATITLFLEAIPCFPATRKEKSKFLALHSMNLEKFAYAFKEFRIIADEYQRLNQPKASTYYANLTHDHLRMEAHLIELGYLEAREDASAYSALANPIRIRQILTGERSMEDTSLQRTISQDPAAIITLKASRAGKSKAIIP
ncbi:hypothetical protein DFP72DRAFT_532921 [Ephemerocybe angulata]|uniref:Uncharacterized protein n=1 Tax=Ephemerocybe angulata TaxID=980116 RepID=A0A8H6HQ81_9AGAR|nr:hypothetical protein DFP72DRAFT_532921 [Tulosesus angulatus]